nr:NAD-glutamate dehydrogenase [Oceanococcus sp. HetDA_MAG_MS8]
MTPSSAPDQERELVLEQLDTLCQQEVSGQERGQVIEFLRAYYAGVETQILSRCHPPDLLHRGLAHRGLVQSTLAEPARFEFEELSEGQGWLFRLVTPDRPFLVDTLLMTMRRQHAQVRWMVHPVLAVERQQGGQFRRIADNAASHPESLIQMELEGLNQAQVSALEEELTQVLRQLQHVVEDFPLMRARLQEEVNALAVKVPDVDPAERQEIAEFLRWLEDGHFTFLGYQRIRSTAEGGLSPDVESGLGLWRASETCPIQVAPEAEMYKYAASKRPIVITTTEGRSPIHHDEYCDVVVIKLYDDAGEPCGTARFLGLFSSEVFNTLPRRIPVVRRKIEQVMRRSQLRPGGHSAKQLRDILNNLPRDELFQSSVRELYTLVRGVQTVRESQHLRLFLRRDRYGRFYSCLIYQHRDRYSSRARRAMSAALLRLLGGHEVEHEVSFQRDGLARIHLTVRTPPGTSTPLTVEELEQRLVELATRWEDAVLMALSKVLPDKDAKAIAQRWLGLVPAPYREEMHPLEAATDLQYLRMLRDVNDLKVRLLAGESGHLDLKLYGLGEMPSLSVILPMLEHFGLQVLRQHPYNFGEDGQRGWLQHFAVRLRAEQAPDRERRAGFEEAFVAAWSGAIEDDGLNALVLMAGLPWREAALIRALAKYAQQTLLPFSSGYTEGLLRSHPEFIADLVQLFRLRFHPELQDCGAEIEELTAQLQARRDAVESLDADRLLACMLSVVQSTQRTNFFQSAADGQPKSYISLKIRSGGVLELPEPRPMVETFVYAPEVEGIHLRGGPVARGGLRWSDRREDFRTEVLGLVKAQMVKNAVIVPTGAKGGFVVKQAVDRRDRTAWSEAGIACYRIFIRGLLDITDNLVDGAVVPPKQVRRHDGDDPYLVVAADKGTASFSDIANALSEEYAFWLGDAFASGGSAGYDHKKMGITARGAWESVKRHFLERGHDVQTQDFTVIGIGDMGGDVFGNGMLLSEHVRLLAAFNHQHIFIDPSPDAARSFAERQRLFSLPRSSWTDYDASVISEGGGVFARSAKSISLSEQARKALGIEASTLSPNALIKAILQAPADLLWNGGIGTYVKATAETQLDVGDRSNDALRIDARQLRVAVIGEGGNLGLTQLARIEAARAGVRVITDSNDNAGGVNSSDREVNLKIPLNALMRAGHLPRADRDALLFAMTEDLAQRVLRDSDLQTQSICLQAGMATSRLSEHAALIRSLERHAGLVRDIEALPSEEALAERRSAGQGLSMPELAVLVSYAKLDLFAQVVHSPLPQDPALEQDLLEYFPPAVVQAHAQSLREHRLRNEIIATVTTNRLVNRMGPSFARRVAEERQLPLYQVVQAWLAATHVLGGEQRWTAMEAANIPIRSVYGALDRLAGLLKHMSLWLLTEHPELPNIADIVQRYHTGMAELEAALPQLLAPSYEQRHAAHFQAMVAEGASEAQATAHANHHILGALLDVLWVAQSGGLEGVDVARAYFLLGDQLDLPWMLESINHLTVKNRWQAMARVQLREETHRMQRDLLLRILDHDSAPDPCHRLQHWQSNHTAALEQIAQSIAELKSLDAPDSAGLSVLLGQLRRLSAN